MTGSELKSRLYDLRFTAGFNIRYHHCYEAWYGKWDKIIRASVGLLAVAGLVLSIKDYPPVGMWLGIASLALAVVLNVIPVADWEKKHGELFRLWSDLREDLELAEIGCCDLGDECDVEPHYVERLEELKGKEARLHSTEYYPNVEFLKRCQGDEVSAEWGPEIRTLEQAEQERARRLKVSTSAAVAASQG